MDKRTIKPNDLSDRQFLFVCRGCTIGNRGELWENYCSSISEYYNWEIDNSYLDFREEPKNKRDPNAIQIICKGEFYGMLGYVGREYTRDIKRIIQNCSEYRIGLVDDNEVGEKEINLVLYFNMSNDSDINSEDESKFINEKIEIDSTEFHHHTLKYLKMAKEGVEVVMDAKEFGKFRFLFVDNESIM